MRIRARLPLLATLATGLLPLSLAGTATAATLNLSPAGAMTLTTLGTADMIGEGGLIDITLSCNMALTGTLESAIPDTAGSTLGGVTGGRSFNCDNGSSGFLFTEPSTWQLTLESVNLTNTQATLLLHDFRFYYTVLGNTCLFSGDLPLLLDFSGRGPFTTGLATSTANWFVLVSGSFLCPTDAIFYMSVALTPQTLTLS